MTEGASPRVSGGVPRDWDGALAAHRSSIDAFAGHAAALGPDTWHLPRAEGKWTPAETTLHLVQTYEVVADGLAGGAGIRRRVPAWQAAVYRWLILPRMLRTGWFPPGARAPGEIRPAPERARLSTPAALAGELRAASARAEAALVSTLATEPARRITHPYFGGLRLPVMLRFLTVHVRHHHAQLRADRPRGA